MHDVVSIHAGDLLFWWQSENKTKTFNNSYNSHFDWKIGRQGFRWRALTLIFLKLFLTKKKKVPMATKLKKDWPLRLSLGDTSLELYVTPIYR